MLCVCEIYRAHAKELSAVICDVVYERHYLLSLVVVALDRVVVHRHDQQAALLPHLEDVGVVDRVREHGLVCEAIDEQLVIQRDKQVLLLATARQKRQIVVQQHRGDLYRRVLVLELRLQFYHTVVWVS